MRIVIATAKTLFLRGGAELLSRNLVAALEARGHEVDMVEIPMKSDPPARILDHVLACRLLDLTGRADLVIGIKFPGYCVRHPNKIIWLLHQHRSAYELWSHPAGGDMLPYPEGRQVRQAIHQIDGAVLSEARALFASSRTVAERLMRYNGITAVPLYHPPPRATLYHCRTADDFFFFPSRLNPLKRQMLVVEALRYTKRPVKVLFAGGGEAPDYLERLHKECQKTGVASRAVWMGDISDGELISCYSRCIGVIYPTLDEDYGYVTLEAMLSAKPVISCTDSAGPTEFIVADHTGILTKPEPAQLAAALDPLWDNRAKAAEMGRAGRDHYQDLGISWEKVAHALTTAIPEQASPCG